MRYWDTSTLAKLYVAESDSPRFSAHWFGCLSVNACPKLRDFRAMGVKHPTKKTGAAKSGASAL
jgi:hypothetical protein